MGMIRLTANYDDLSTDKGYQFKFYCDRCHNGHMSRFQLSMAGTAGSLLRAAGDLFGGILGSAGNSAYEIQRAVGGKAHDSALEVAVEEGKQFFRQCTRCGSWVCPDVCWNASASLCENCAPDYHEEFASSQAHAKVAAARDQLNRMAEQIDYASGANMAVDAQVSAASTVCTSCGAKASGKFCGECGAPTTAAKLTCPGCGHQPEGSPRFCPECGAKMQAWK